MTTLVDCNSTNSVSNAVLWLSNRVSGTFRGLGLVVYGRRYRFERPLKIISVGVVICPGLACHF